MDLEFGFGYHGLTADTDGNLYTAITNMGWSGDIYKIDPVAKTYSKVVSLKLGMFNSPYMDSTAHSQVAIDYATGDFYFFYDDQYDGYQGMYLVDLTTGEMTLVNDYGGECITWGGVFCVNQPVQKGAPLACENFALNFVNEALTGTVSFTMPPAVDGEGKPISEDMKYIVKVDVEVSTDNTKTWTKIGELLKAAAPGAKPEWLTNRFDLSAYKDCKNIVIAFHATSTVEDVSMLLDNIKVLDEKQVNLSLREADFPTNARPGDLMNVRVKVSNDGLNPVSGAKLNVYLGTIKIASQPIEGELPVDKYKNMTFDFFLPSYLEETVELVAEVEVDDDEILDDNAIGMDVEMLTDIYPAVENMKGSTAEDGSVAISWEAPKADGFRFTETFERFESWSIGGIDIKYDPYTAEVTGVVKDEGDLGTFHLIDNDHVCTTWFLNTAIDHPNQIAPMAGTVLDVFYPENLFREFPPYDGEKAFSFMSSTFAQSDEYLVLPELSSDKTISFYARSGTAAWGLDKIEICVSTAETPARDSFHTFVRPFEMPFTGKEDYGYTRYEFTLPDDTRWAAIHYVTFDRSLTLIDNLSCSPLLRTLGYRVYRNNELVNEDELLTTPSFTDNGVEGDIWRITPVFKGGIEGLGTTYLYGATGVNVAGNAKGSITSSGLRVYVSGIDAPVYLYDMTGRQVGYSNSGLQASIELPAAGLYVVKAGTVVSKIYVH